jgi:hypothetical protein
MLNARQPSTLNDLSRVMPLRPSRMLRQNASRPMPQAAMGPSPVMTTRRLAGVFVEIVCGG